MNTATLHHAFDPDTSRTAAINLSGSATEKVMHVLVDILDQHGPLTPAELEHHYFHHRERWRWPVVAFYSIHRRVSQMKKHVGCLVPSGRRDGAQLLSLSCSTLDAHLDVTNYMRKDAA